MNALKIITIQKEALMNIIKNELKEALTILVITIKGKKMVRMIFVRNLIEYELSGSGLKNRRLWPKAIRK